MNIWNTKRLNYTTNGITFHITFYESAYSGQRRNKLVKILNVCAQYILLPKEVDIHMHAHQALHIKGRGKDRFAGCALPDGKTIYIAKLKLSEMSGVIAHELGHVEHFTLHPLSSKWSERELEEYADTIEEYYDQKSGDLYPYELRLSQYIRINKEGRIIRATSDIAVA